MIQTLRTQIRADKCRLDLRDLALIGGRGIVGPSVSSEDRFTLYTWL